MKRTAAGTIHRRGFLCLLASAAVACLGLGIMLRAEETPPAAKPVLTFGVVTDVQYADVPTQAKRQYRESLLKAEHCVADFNKMRPEFVIHLGDLINENYTSYDAVLPIFDKLSMPRYFCLGNHDLSLDPESRAKVLPRLGLDKLGSGKGYYDFARAGWRMVVLNGNDISIVASAAGSEERKAAERLVADLKKKGAKNTSMYNGALGPQQLAWLKETLAKADAAGERAIVFCHFPVYPTGGSNLWNDTEVLDVLGAHKCVAAYFCGHVHGGGYARKGGIHFVNFKGVVEADPTAYALVEVFADSLKVTGFGAEPSRVLKVEAAAPAPAAK
ncbi:MAG: metallophosphoesterase [Planctomycetota bacterium]|nr:metallophosphoesterase [Planctomycetota bacterium]